MATADLSGVSLHLVDSVEMAGKFLTWLGERRPDDVIAVDTETGEKPGNPRTDAFSPWHGRLRLVQVGDGLTGWAIPWDRWNGVFHEAMDRYQGEIICHNVAFEAKWFAIQSDFRIPWHRTHDTMIVSQVVNPLMSAALKSLTKRFVDSRAAGLQQLLDQKMVENGWTWGTIPINVKEYWSYGALDCVLTVRLWHALKAHLEPYKNVYDMEMAVRRVCTQMELNGARVDVPYSEAQYARLNGHAQSIREWVKDAYKINAGSPSQLTDVFVGRLGGIVTETTPSGQPKMDKTQLKKFSINGAGTPLGQLADQVLAMRKSAKLADTYFANFISGNIDGLMHPQIRTLGARTSRMSITDPALQTLPKKDKVVRKAFIPRDPETEIILSCDLEQVEFRMMAALCADPALVALFEECDRTGDDAFTRMGQDIYADPRMVKSDSRRALIKTFTYGTLYGAGIATSAVNAGVTEARMKEVAGAFNSRYPGVKGFMQQVEHEGMTRLRNEGEAYVMTKMGRRLPADEGRAYTLVNYCLAPETPILTSSLEHMPASKISVGDRLVAFDENTTGNGGLNRWGQEHKVRRLRTAVVEAITIVKKPSVRVTVADGRTVDCSEDHLWLVHTPYKKKGQPWTLWKPAIAIEPGDQLLSSGTPWQEDTSKGAGWLAGMYDGEGCLGSRAEGNQSTQLMFAQNAGPVMDRFVAEMTQRGYDFTFKDRHPSNNSPCQTVHSYGVFPIMRILGSLRPTRFASRFESFYEGSALTGGTTEYQEVTSVKPIGDLELVSIQTTTRTLIANGLLSHNCIQGGAAEVFKLCMLKADAAGLLDYMVVPVHDELVLSVPKDESEEIGKILQECMTTRDGWAVPLLAGEPATGARWGDLSG